MEGLVLIGHGSAVAGANRDMLRIAAALERGGRCVRSCTVDRAEADLPGLVEACAGLGARRVVVLPWLLQLGRHLREDIPRAIAAARQRCSGVEVLFADPLGFDDLLVQLAERRIAQVQGGGAGPAGIFLVGAGPGDPGMLTVRARELLTSCDCLIHDRLVAPELLALVPAEAVRHAVGKRGWGVSCPQEDINRLLVECAHRHRRVVRLKGGDPLVFSRGGEEIAALAEAGLAVEVVPGITTALGAAAALGLPLTLRNQASSLALVTGHAWDGGAACDWRAVAGIDTIVLYMGSRHLAEHCARLVAAGRAADTPACAVQWATRPEQRVVEGSLADLPRLVTEAGMGSPLLVIVGSVVRRRRGSTLPA